MKLAIIGSRSLNFNFEKHISPDIDTIVSGGASGIDTLAEKYADEHNIDKIIIKPDYRKFGKYAPIKRNKSIIELADIVVAFWGGQSSGTKFSIDYAKSIGKKVIVHKITPINTKGEL